jgi:RHS repeat-associated protein
LARDSYADSNGAEFDGHPTQWLLADGLGDVKEAFTAATSDDGTTLLTGEFLYDAFGTPTYATTGDADAAPGGAGEGVPVTPRWRFGGQEYDAETGLVHELHRYYSTADGRFISQDPSGLGPDANAYRHVGNDPLGGLDPTGLFSNIIASMTGGSAYAPTVDGGPPSPSSVHDRGPPVPRR